MKRTMQYSVGGQTVDVPADEIDQFNEAARLTGAQPVAMHRFRVNGQSLDVPENEIEGFSIAARQSGIVPQEIRTMQMSDGSSREFTAGELSKFLRSDEYRKSADYAPTTAEQGSLTWASIKGALSGMAEGAWEGGKAGVAKAAWALPQVVTGVMRAVGNAANLGGNAKNAVGNALVGGANAADEWMERTMPTSTAERLGYEDWGTKTGDFFGNVAGTAVKFAPAGGASVLSKVFTEAMLASDGINAYAQTYDQAKGSGLGDLEANGLGVTSGLVNYFGGKALLKAGGVGAKIQNPLLRELAAAGAAGGVMGAQGGANQAIGNLATGKPVGEGVAGAVAEGVAEGAAFHGANMIPRLPKVVRQTREHFNAAKDWIVDAAKNNPEMLSDLMDQPALTEVIEARRGGADVSRKMGDSIFLPNNMSGEQRNAVVDSIIAYRDGAAKRTLAEKTAAAKARGEAAEAEKQKVADERRAVEAKMAENEQMVAAKEHRERSMRGMEERAQRKAEFAEYERQEAERKAREAEEEARPNDAELAEVERSLPKKQPVEPEMWDDYKAWLAKGAKANNAKNWNRWVMENEMDPRLKMPTADQMRYSRFREEMESRKGGVAEEPQKREPYDNDIPRDAAVEEERRGAEMLRNRDADFKRLKDAGFSDEDAWYYLTYGKEAFYKHRAEEFEKSRGKKPDGKGRMTAKVEKPAAPIATESAKVSQTPAPKPDGKGKMVKKPAAKVEEPVAAPAAKPKPVADTLKSQSDAEIVRDAMKSDPVLQKIDAAYKAAKTDAERNALQEQFKARVAELREAKAAAGDKTVTEDAKKKAFDESNPDSWLGEYVDKKRFEELKATKPANLKMDVSSDASWLAKENPEVPAERIWKAAEWYGVERERLSEKGESLVEFYEKYSGNIEAIEKAMGVKSKPVPAAEVKKPDGKGRVRKTAQKPPKTPAEASAANLSKPIFVYESPRGVRIGRQGERLSDSEMTIVSKILEENGIETGYVNYGSGLDKGFLEKPKESKKTFGLKNRSDFEKAVKILNSINDKLHQSAEPAPKAEQAPAPTAAKSAESAKRVVAKADGKAKAFDPTAAAKADKKNGISVTPREFGNYDVQIVKDKDIHEFKIRKDKKTGEYSIADADGNVIDSVSMRDGFAFESKEELVDFLKDQAKAFVDGDYDAVERHARGIAEKKTRGYGDEIGKLKHISDSDKRAFRKLSQEYEDAYAEARQEGVTESKLQGLNAEDLADFGIEEGSPAHEAATKFIEARDALERFHEQAVKYSKLKRGKDGRPIWSKAEADRIEALRSDPAVRKWVEDGKRGEVVDGKVSPRNVVDYLRDQVDKAVTATKRVFSDAKVEVKDRDFNPLIDEKDGATTFKAADGRVVGTFDPATKHVTLYRGADAKTVYHELIGHGVEDWAARNNRPLHDKLIELAKTAPKELTDAIRERYPDADEATLAKEIIANIAEGKGFDRIKLKEAPKAWYAKAYVAVRDALLGFMEKIGLRRVDLSKIDEMSPNEVMDHLMDEIDKGKTLGEIGAASDGKVGLVEHWADAIWKRHASLEKTDKNAAYEKQIQPGKEAAFQNLVYNKRVSEMKKMLADGDVAIESVDELMKATAALERNKADREAHVQRLLNEGMPKNMAEEKADILINKLNQGTSGMSDAVAEATIRHYEGSAKYAEIKKVADFLWKIQDEGMMERVRAGLVAQKDYDGWKAKEPHHVPFRSAVDETTGEWVNGWSRGMESPEFIQHQGRFSESGSPSTWILQEFSNAFMRGIENDTRLVLAKAVEANPALGKIVESPTLKEYRGKGSDGDPNVVSYKTINDKGESVTRHIYLYGERGAMAASSYTNAKMSKMPAWAQRAMRMWSATATELSPTFALRNFSADNLGFAKMVLLERGAKDGSRFLKDYAKNHKAVAREVWDFVRNGNVDENSTLGKYMKNGAMIGGFQREGYTDIKDAFSAKAIAKDFAAGRNRGAAIVRNTLGLVKAINGYSELANRVADFKTRLEWGEDMKTAVKQSREDFVDFNQKGNRTPITNTLYMFANSNIGATMRQLQAANKSLRTWKGRRALIGLAVFGAAEAAIEHFWNAQQDAENEKKGEATGKDVNEHTRKVSLYFRHGGNVYRLPVHEDPLMRIVYAANATTRWALGDMDGKTFAKEILNDVAGDIPVYFGIGTKDPSAGWNTWFPTGIQPFVQMWENKDYAGRPIYRPKFNEAMPDSQNGRQSTSEVYKWIAETLNAATGGNEGRKGAVDLAPETVKFVNEWATKNMGKDLANAADTGWRILTGDFKGIDSRRVPVVRDIVRKSEGNDNRYFEAARRYDDDAHEWKTMKAEWTPEERRAYIKDHPWVRRVGDKSPLAQRIQTEVNKLRRMESGQRRRKDGSWTKAEYTEEQLEKIKTRRRELQARLIEKMSVNPKK